MIMRRSENLDSAFRAWRRGHAHQHIPIEQGLMRLFAMAYRCAFKGALEGRFHNKEVRMASWNGEVERTR